MVVKKKITVYTSQNCVPCMHLKGFLKQEGWDYESLGLQDAANDGYRSVPVIKVDDKVIIGFKEETKKELKDLLENGKD